MAYSFTSSVASQKPKGIQAVYVKLSSETNYSRLGFIRNGNATIKALDSSDTYLRQFPHAVSCEYKFEMLQASLTEIELLDTLTTNGSVDMVIQAVDNSYYVHNASNTRLGITAKVVDDGAFDKNRFIEITASVGIKLSDFETVLPSSAPTLGTSASGETFYSITTATSGLRANIKPAGIRTAEISVAGVGSPSNIGRISNAKINLEVVAESDSVARPNPYALDINVEFDWLQTANADLVNLDNTGSDGADYILTALDGLIYTLTDKCGIYWTYENSGNFEGFKTVKVVGKGRTLISNLDGIVS